LSLSTAARRTSTDGKVARLVLTAMDDWLVVKWRCGD